MNLVDPPSVSAVAADPSRRRLLLAALAGGALATWPGLAAAALEPLDSADTLSEMDAAARIPAIDWEWVDTARQRKVPVRLYWPEPGQAAATQPVPLVVFSHGIGGSRLGYSYLGRHLATQGWACLHVQHVGSDRGLWWGNPFGLVGRLREAARDSEALDRVHDLRFALDRLLDPALTHAVAGRLADRIDARRIVAAGHSYGANTTMLSIGARVVRGQQVYELLDPRYRAAILMSAPPFYGEHDVAAILSPVKVPTLHITSNEDVILIPGYRSGVEDRIALYDAMPDARKALAVFSRGSHGIFTDRTVTGGIEINQQVKGATRALAAAFLRQQFEQDAAALPMWRQNWQGIVARTAGLLAAEPAKPPSQAAGAVFHLA
jgi:dienelactone hydrolase